MRTNIKSEPKKTGLNFEVIREGLVYGLVLGSAWNLPDLIRLGPKSFISGFFYKGLFMFCGFFVGGCLLAAARLNRRK